MGSLSSPNLIKDVYTSLVFRKSDGIFYRDDGTDDVALFNPSILDEDNMASNSATRIASQQSIKAYVDAQVTASDLDFQGDSGGALSIDLDSETLTLTGGTGVDTAGSSNTITFSLDLNELGTESSIADADFLSMVDATDSGSGKVLFSNLQAAIVATGALNSGSITNGFGTIDIGGSALTAGSGTSLAGLSLLDGNITNVGSIQLDSIAGDGDTNTSIEFSGSDIITISTGGETQVTFNNGSILPTTDSDVDLGSTGARWKDAFVDSITVTGEVDGATLDISGNADIDGTLEADAYTVNGTALDEYIADTVGAMVGSNTESGITVAYQDGDNTLDFTVGTLNQNTTGNADTATLATNFTASANNSADETVYPVFIDGATGTQGAETDTGLTYNPSSGLLTSTAFSGNITGNVTGNTSGTAATVTGAAQTNITSLGTLTALTVDNLGVNGNTITANSGALNLTPASGSAIVLDGTINVDAGVVTGATSITSTVFVGNITGNVTGNTSGTAATVTTAAQSSITSLGTLTTLTVDDVIINGATIGHTGDTDLMTVASGVLTVAGEVDATSLDVSGDADIDGTLEADAITVNGSTLASVIAGTTVANATLAATTTVTDSTANTNFPVIFHDESNALLDDTGALRYNPSTGTLLVPNLSVAGTTTTVDTVTMEASNAIIFEGATADAHEATLTIVDPTADRTINLPNQSGTLPVLAAVSTTAITSTPEELNILDGATVVVGEINALDLGATAVGTAIASKAVILDSNKDYTGVRNLTITGELDSATLDVSGNADIDGTTNLDAVDIDGNVQLDGTLTVGVDGTGKDVKLFGDTSGAYILWDESADKLLTAGGALVDIVKDKLMIGSTAVTTTAAELNLLDGVTSTTDEINMLDGGNSAATVTIADDDRIILNDAGTMKQVAVSALNTYTSGSIAADNISAASSNVTIDAAGNNTDIIFKGTDATADITMLTLSGADAGAATFNNKVVATELDISGNADIDGTLEADAYTVDGTALNEYISDTVGAMVGSNTESGITVAYQDADNTLDFTVGTLNQDTTGTAATVTGAAQSNITSLGTLTTLTVDNVIVNGSTIGHTGDTDLMTVASGVLTVAGEVSMTTLDIGGTNVTSTAAELNALDGITAVVGELNALDIGATAVGTAVASKAVILDSNKDYTGLRNLTITGELDAATLDISGAIDVAGTTNLDAVDIDGVVQIDSTLTVGVNDTGYDVKFFGATSGAYMLYDESDNALKCVESERPLQLSRADGNLHMRMTAADDHSNSIEFINASGTAVYCGMFGDQASGAGNWGVYNSGFHCYIDSGGTFYLPTANLYMTNSSGTLIASDANDQNIAFAVGGSGTFEFNARVNVSGDCSVTSLYLGGGGQNDRFSATSVGSGSNSMFIGNEQITTSSDVRLKKNITDTTFDAVSELKKLRVVDFTWDDPSDLADVNKNSRGKWTGLIAQEVVEHLPFVVNAPRDLETNAVIPDSKQTNDNGEEIDLYWGLEYDKIVPVLIKAVQELSAKVTALENK